MPSFVGSSQILNVSGDASIIFGDTAFISPKTAAKTTHGAGGGTTGAFVTENNFNSMNNTFDSSVLQQPTVGNN